ncbi:MAG: hypothetical protein ACKVT1_02170 [Dehalococcoidia bacterium]
MGFYYGSGSPPPEEKPGGIKEALLITWAVFRALALPLGVLFGGIALLVLLFVLFAIHPLAGFGGILFLVAVVTARGLWEWRHPPTLKG